MSKFINTDKLFPYPPDFAARPNDFEYREKVSYERMKKCAAYLKSKGFKVIKDLSCVRVGDWIVLCFEYEGERGFISASGRVNRVMDGHIIYDSGESSYGGINQEKDIDINPHHRLWWKSNIRKRRVAKKQGEPKKVVRRRVVKKTEDQPKKVVRRRVVKK